MALITNLENNLRLEISFKENNLFDYNMQRTDYENWIPFILSLTLPKRSIIIDETVNAAMTVYEIKNLICGIENILENLEKKNNFIYECYSSESFFGLKLETIPEDAAVEVELWINVGNQTGGEVYGYDEGIRFATSDKMLMNFLTGIKNEV